MGAEDIPGKGLFDQHDPCSAGNSEQENQVNKEKVCSNQEVQTECQQPPYHCDRDPEHGNTPAQINKNKWFWPVLVAVVITAIVIILALLAAWCPQPLFGPACPYDWIGYRGRCYFFSKEQRNWTFSNSFCSLQEAHLLTFRPTQEKEFVMLYKGKAPFWIGLRRDPGQPWKWTNGDISTLNIVGDGGNCAFLNSAANATSSRCRTELRWICSKHDIFKSQNTR